MREKSGNEYAKAGWLIVFSLAAMIVAFSCDQTTGPGQTTISVKNRLRISADSISIPANGGSTRVLVQVYAGTDTTKTVSGVRVQFSTSPTNLGSIQIQNDVTDANGYARATVYGGSKTGSMGVTASIENFSNTLFISVTPGAGLVFSSPSEILADGLTQSKITATVIDSLGQPSPGALVKFASTAGTITSQSYTDDKGKAEALLRSTASITDISAVVTASTEGIGKPAILTAKPAEVKVKQDDNSAKPVVISNILGIATVVFKGITVSGTVGKTTVFANNADSTLVNVTVKETTSGAPVPKAHLTFTSSLGILRAKEADTDNTGNAKVIFFGSNVSGTAVLTAAYAPVLTYTTEISLTKQLYMDLMSSPSSLSANGTDVANIKAQITDADGNPIQGEKVYFSTTLGTILPSAVTDLWGNASVSLKSPRQNGRAEVHAKYKTIEKVTYVQFTGADVKVQATPMILVANNSDRSTLSISMTDASGSPVVGSLVNLSTAKGTLISEDGKTIGVSIVDSTSTTGKITAYLKSRDPGDAVVTVSALGISETVTVIFTDYTFSITSAQPQILAGGTKVLVTATLFDKNGKVTPINLADVNFSTTLGTIAPKERTPDGRAVAELTSSKSAGTSTVTAFLKTPPISSTMTIPFIAAGADSVVIKADKMSVRLGGGTVDIRATVYDVTGNTKAGSTVTFTILKGPGGGEEITPATAVTDDRGQASVTFRSGSRGTEIDGVEIQAQVEKKTSNVVKMTIAGEPYSVVVGFSSSFVSNNDGTLGVGVTAIVSDVNRNKVVDNTIVNFSLRGNVGVIEGQVPTLGGVASTMLIYSPSDAGKEVEVTASSGGISQTGKLRLPGKAGAIGKLQVSAGKTQILADGIDVVPMTVFLTGVTGEPLSNQTVYCSANIGKIDPSAITGDPSEKDSAPGKAKVVYTGAALRNDTTTLIKVWAEGYPDTVKIQVQLKGISISAATEPDILPADGQSKATISVLIKETTTQIPISSQDVLFGASDGYIAGKSTTDASGVAKTIYTAGFKAGTADIMVSFGATLVETTHITVYAVKAQGIEVFASPSQIPANGISTSTITALLRDDRNNPIIGERIQFTTILGTITAMDTTDVNGRAEATLVSERRNGTAMVTAKFKDWTKVIPVNFTGVKLNVSATPENLFAGENEKTTVTAFVKDAAEVPIVGEPVLFDWYLNGVKRVSKTSTTDVQGRANIDFSESVAGRYLVLVSAAGASDSTSINFNKIQFVIADSNPDTVRTGGVSLPVKVKLFNTETKLPLNGQSVEFYTTLGTIDKNSVTNSQGEAVVSLKSGNTAGIATVLATTMYQGQRVSAEKKFTFINSGPDSVQLSLDANIVSVGGGNSRLIALVTDSSGNPVSDVLVSFKILKGPAGGEFIKPISATTGPSGIATTYLYSGQVPSTFEAVQVLAEVGSVSSNVAKLTIAGAPETIKPSYPTLVEIGKIDNGNGTFTLPISATVLDINSNFVVDGTTVYFKIDPPEGVVLSPAKTQNSVAVSQITYPATSAGKAVELTASAGGKEGKIRILLYGFTVSYVSVTASPKSIVADGKSTCEIRATLFDNTGSSKFVPDGTTISFITDGGTLNPIVAVTKDGMAITTLTSDKAPKYVSVTAQSGASKDVTTIRFEEIVSYLTVTTTPRSIKADGISSCDIIATLFNSIGELVPDGTTVSFTSDGGLLPTVVALTKNGIATVKLTSDRLAKDVSVSAISGNARGSSFVKFEEVIYYPTLTAQPSIIPADGKSTSVITITLKDDTGRPCPDGTLLSFTSSGLEGATINPLSVTTKNGVATLTLTSGTKAGDFSITVESGKSKGMVTIKIQELVSFINVTAISPTLLADGKSTTEIRAVLKNEDGNPVPDGTVITFSTTGGSLNTKVSTALGGTATAILTSSTTPGEVVVTVKSGQMNETVKVIFKETVSYITATATPSNITADGKTTCEIKATLKDYTGAFVKDGTVVSFSTDGGTLESAVVTTTNGVAITRLTSDKTQKDVNVTALSGSIKDIAKVIFEEAGVNINQVSDIVMTVSNSTIEADGITSAIITAQLRKFNGDPIDVPTTVVFSTDIGEVSKFVRSDQSGRAVAQFTSGVVGTATISASVGTIKGYTNVIVVPGKPQSIQLSFTPTTVGVQKSGRNETLQIKADVKDNKNNPVRDGNMIKFELVGAYDTGVTITPGGTTAFMSRPVPTVNGIATVSFHSGTRAGTIRVKATVVDSTGVVVTPVVSSETTQFQVFSGPAFLDTSNLNDPFTNSHITVAGAPLNIFAGELNTVNSTTTISVLVGDRYNNPVTEGTAVYFTTTGGVITTRTGFTDAQGMATVTLFAGNPFPTVANSASVENPNAALGGPAIFAIPMFDYDGDGTQNNGIATITAYTQGVDQQGRQVTAWNYVPIVFSKHVDVNTGFTVTPGVTTLLNGQSTNITIMIKDINGNPVVGGSTIDITSLLGELSPAKITTNSPGTTVYSVTLKNSLDPTKDMAGNTVITVKLKGPYGEYIIKSVPIFMSLI
ncbi:MAG: invasin domain 3-containing protein [Candidatus Latescibacter sp.]|nr:invasin domain 3-containing protein [Candidatus Latescibacter sp.]